MITWAFSAFYFIRMAMMDAAYTVFVIVYESEDTKDENELFKQFMLGE